MDDLEKKIETANVYKFSMTASFLRTYAQYLEHINAQNEGKNFVLQLQVDLRESFVPPLAIVEIES